MKTIADIIKYAINADYGRECTYCNFCSKLNWCYVDSIECALNYLYKGEY